MELKSNTFKNVNKTNSSITNDNEYKEAVLCKHCKRTKSNKLRCLGICVADSDY